MVTAGQVAGASQFSDALFNLGEALVVVAGVAYFWVAHVHHGEFWTWVVAALPALAFSVMYLVSPAMTGIIAIWSMGLTLYLPWPLYTISLWLAGVGTIRLLRAGEPSGWAILLLAAGGYPPQLSSHVIMGLVALWLLAAPAQTADDDHQTQNEFSSLPIHTVSA